MKRGLKILVGVVVALVLVIVVALAGVLLFFNPNDYKSQINAAIRSEIGRPVTIQGQIRLSVFPWLGIKLGRVSVANAEGFGDQPLATMQSAGVGVRLLPLLGRHIDIGTVSLNGLQVHLARDAQGKTNWGGIVSHLSGGSGATVASSSRPTKKSGQVSGLDLNSLQIQKVDVQNAAVYWSDATTGADYRLTGVHAQTGLLADGKPVQLKVGGHLAVPGKAMQVALEAAARVAPNLSNQDYRFSKLNMTLDATGASIPGNRQQVKLTATGDINLHAGSFEVADLSLQAAGLDVRGQLKGSGLNGHLRYGGQLTAAQFDPRKVMQGLQIKPPATRKQDALSSAAFDTGFQGSADKI